VEELFSALGQVAVDFGSELREWGSPAYYEDHVKRVQLPFVLSARPPPADPEALKVPRLGNILEDLIRTR
jgi:hypothetical protein